MKIETSKITLRAVDGHELSAASFVPPTPTGAIVLLHESFGLNQHIREVAEAYACKGLATIVPALFDRAERGVALGYDEEGSRKGCALREAVGWRGPLLDVQAAINAAQDNGPVAVIGYGWGGSLAFVAAARLIGLACAVGYYGAQTMPFAQEEVHVPVMLHFGEFDPDIPPEDIAAICEANPEIQVRRYPADHGFSSAQRPEWHQESAERALEYTLGFLREHLGRPG